MKEFGGSEYQAVNQVRVAQIAESLWCGLCRNAEEKEMLQSAAFLTALGINPKDDVEGMLVAQMIATNAATMECFRRAMNREQPFDARQLNLSFANKLSRTYAMQMDALQRYRGKGQQKVTVEHVHVHAGGQAIVGAVTGGGGVQQKTEEQPHAKQIESQPSTYVPMPPLPCADKEREPVPIARDAER